MTNDLSKYNDYQLQMILMNTEQDGKHAKAMVQAGNEAYRPKHADLQAKWKAVKAEMKRRASPAADQPSAPGLAPAAGQPEKVSPQEFHRMCAAHDWNHEYSDDPGAYRAGRDSAARLLGVARSQPELAPILKRWQEHVVAGGPRPQEPAERPT
jgi:hypothetical protein